MMHPLENRVIKEVIAGAAVAGVLSGSFAVRRYAANTLTPMRSVSSRNSQRCCRSFSDFRPADVRPSGTNISDNAAVRKRDFGDAL
jgi:hypothetical protein